MNTGSPRSPCGCWRCPPRSEARPGVAGHRSVLPVVAWRNSCIRVRSLQEATRNLSTDSTCCGPASRAANAMQARRPHHKKNARRGAADHFERTPIRSRRGNNFSVWVKCGGFVLARIPLGSEDRPHFPLPPKIGLLKFPHAVADLHDCVLKPANRVLWTTSLEAMRWLRRAARLFCAPVWEGSRPSRARPRAAVYSTHLTPDSRLRRAPVLRARRFDARHLGRVPVRANRAGRSALFSASTARRPRVPVAPDLEMPAPSPRAGHDPAAAGRTGFLVFGVERQRRRRPARAAPQPVRRRHAASGSSSSVNFASAGRSLAVFLVVHQEALASRPVAMLKVTLRPHDARGPSAWPGSSTRTSSRSTRSTTKVRYRLSVCRSWGGSLLRIWCARSASISRRATAGARAPPRGPRAPPTSRASTKRPGPRTRRAPPARPDRPSGPGTRRGRRRSWATRAPYSRFWPNSPTDSPTRTSAASSTST